MVSSETKGLHRKAEVAGGIRERGSVRPFLRSVPRGHEELEHPEAWTWESTRRVSGKEHIETLLNRINGCLLCRTFPDQTSILRIICPNLQPETDALSTAVILFPHTNINAPLINVSENGSMSAGVLSVSMELHHTQSLVSTCSFFVLCPRASDHLMQPMHATNNSLTDVVSGCEVTSKFLRITHHKLDITSTGKRLWIQQPPD